MLYPITHSSNLLTRQLTSVVRQKSDNLNQQITPKVRPRASYHPRDHLGTISGPLDRNKEKLEAILLHNYIFPDTAYTLHGFGLSKNGEFQVLVAQPYVYCNDIKLSQLEINQFALKIGFKKDTEGNHNYTNGNIKLRDLHNENIMMDHWGNIRVIDNIIRLT